MSHAEGLADARRMAAFFEAGLRTGAFSPTVDLVFGFDDVHEAHRYLDQGSLLGKVVLTT